jgi:hypothetical protein
VIFLFMVGGPSQIDMLDPKPRVTSDHGKPLPFEKPKLERTKTGNLPGSPWKFARHGQSGIEVSELLPGLASRIDDVCVIRSMVADNINHSGAWLQMCTGEQAFSRPSMGSWVTYGLGTENANLPAFVVLSPTSVFQGAPLYSASFLPGGCAGTLAAGAKIAEQATAERLGVSRVPVREARIRSRDADGAARHAHDLLRSATEFLQSGRGTTIP